MWVDPAAGQPIRESDSFTCGHCNRVVFVWAGQDPASLGGLCKVCMKLVCPECTDQGVCRPFEKALEAIEAKDRARRSLYR